jgi:glucose/arabinose dehydrogenase
VKDKFILLLILVLIATGTIIFFIRQTTNQEPSTNTPTVNNPTNPDLPLQEVPYVVETVAENLSVPWSILFTDPSRLLVTERSGTIRRIEHSVLQQEPLIQFPEVSSNGEEGLMGLTKDPDYDTNKYLYTAYAYQKNGNLVVKVVRLIDQGNTAVVDQTILDDIPAARNHAGTRLSFGPDNKLYVTTGDASERQIAQNLESLGGKILRLNADGTIPSDNPFSGSSIYSYGHRNPQGIAWNPITGHMYETEHGPSLFDGPPGGDEINRIVSGGNYGWPLVSHTNSQQGLIDPLHVYTPAVAPASAMVYSGSVFPQFTQHLFFGGLVGTGLYHAQIDPDNPDSVTSLGKLSDVAFGRIREVVEGPDGYIYFSTSNKDGRGKPAENDDRILRLVPR